MKKRFIITLVTVVALLFSSVAFSASANPISKTYYISNSGSDQNSGLSQASAWKTFNNIPALNPGDTLLLEVVSNSP